MAMILMYEPNEALAQKLCAALNKQGHTVLRCDADEPTLPVCENECAPVVFLDAQLKWTQCRPLLERFSLLGWPILFLTGDRKMSAHLRALYAGRSAVLPLPFGAKSLRTHLEKLLGVSSQPRALSLDESERVALLDGRRVELTAQEFALLLALMEKPDMPVSREQLLRKAWGYQSMGETRTVDVHVQRLRKKLGGECIETVYKCGYRLNLV